jgi:hypothetical protein
MTYSGALDPARVPGVMITSRTEIDPAPGPWPSKTPVGEVDTHYVTGLGLTFPGPDGDNYTGYEHSYLP